MKKNKILNEHYLKINNSYVGSNTSLFNAFKSKIPSFSSQVPREKVTKINKIDSDFITKISKVEFEREDYKTEVYRKLKVFNLNAEELHKWSDYIKKYIKGIKTIIELI